MDVVIFCGGRGTRLNEMTQVMPKPLVSVGQFPILWHIMKIYDTYGHKRFLLPLGYKGEEIKKWFLHYAWYSSDTVSFTLDNPEPPEVKEDWDLVFRDTGEKTGTAMRLVKMKELITSETFHVTYGDGVSTVNIDKVIAFHKEMREKFGVVGTISSIRPLSKYGVIDADDHGLISSFREKPQMKEYVNIGFMVFDKEIFEYCSDVKEEDMLVNTVLPKLAEDKKLAIYKFDGFFKAMDSYKDYLVLNDMWENDRPWKIW